MAKTDDADTVEPTAAYTPDGEIVPFAATGTMTAAQFDAWLRSAKAEPDDDGVDPYMRILHGVLQAKTPDDVLTPIEAMKARDLIGHALVLLDFEFNESEYDVGSPMYASMHVIHAGVLPPQELELLNIPTPAPPVAVPSGTEVVVNCGHKKVITQCVRLRQLDAFPRRVTFAERGRSKVSGSTMLTLLKWGSDESFPLS